MINAPLMKWEGAGFIPAHVYLRGWSPSAMIHAPPMEWEGAGLIPAHAVEPHAGNPLIKTDDSGHELQPALVFHIMHPQILKINNHNKNMNQRPHAGFATGQGWDGQSEWDGGPGESM